ncbi:MAG: hypothetical protein V3W22_06315 [Thermoplasmata archaeon]
MSEVNGGELALGLIMILVLTPIGFFFFIFPGIIFLIVGILLVVKSVTGGPQASQAQGPQPGYVLCPHCAGQNFPTAIHCQWCGKPMKVQT